MKKTIIKLGLMISLALLTLVCSTACGGKADEIQQEPFKVTRGTVMLSVTGDGNLYVFLCHLKFLYLLSVWRPWRDSNPRPAA